MKGIDVGRPMHILLAEDDPAHARLTVEALDDSEFPNETVVVRDGVEALSYLRQHGRYAGAPLPDLLLLDLNMPRKDGREVLADLRADPSLTHIPVVILTTSSLEQDVLLGYQLHANAYVTKPMDLADFTNVVKAIEAFWFTTAELPSMS